MKILKTDLEYVLNLTRGFRKTKQTIDIEIKEKRLIFRILDEFNILRLSTLIVEEEDKDTVTIERAFLEKIVKNATEEVDLKINEKTVSAKVNGVSFRTNILNDAFKVRKEELETTEYQTLIITKELLEAINYAEKFIDSKNKRPILRGINISQIENTIKIVSTDSYKMLEKTFEVEREANFKVTIQPENIVILNNIFEATTQKPYPIFITENNIFVKNTAIYYAGSILTGEYPNVQQVFSKIALEKTLDTLEINKETERKIKAIRESNNMLDILADETIIFRTRSETRENKFQIKNQNEKKYEVTINSEYLLTGLENTNKLTIKENTFLLINENTQILILGVKR